MTIPGPIPRILGDFGGTNQAGPTLVVLASLHGNEPAGYHAARRIIERLAVGDVPLKGRVVFVTGNRAALEQGRRYVDIDLNRLWTAETLAGFRNGGGAEGEPADNAEARDLLSTIEGLRQGPGRHFILDLHTTSGDSPPFAVLADSLPNRRFARSLHVPVILGLEEQLDGTLLSVLEADGWITSGCEGGRHDDPVAVDHLEAAIWRAMAGSDVIAGGPSAAEVQRAKQFLGRAWTGLPRIFEVRYRHAVRDEDGFRMLPGFASFQSVRGGEEVGHDRAGVVHLPSGGRMLMPLYQPQGSDGFFLMRPVNRFWLIMSGVLRRVGAPALAPLLPGVRRDPARPEVLLVDRTTARWFALEAMHLLGYRRERIEGDLLVVSRRPAEAATPR
jgi:succinylglutamate desuccinylase